MKIKLDFISLVRARPKIAQRQTNDENLLAAINEYRANRGKQALGHKSVAKSHPKLARGQVWCLTCGYTRRVDSKLALRHGWPMCCGATMTIDSPDER